MAVRWFERTAWVLIEGVGLVCKGLCCLNCVCGCIHRWWALRAGRGQSAERGLLGGGGEGIAEVSQSLSVSQLFKMGSNPCW